VTVAQLKKKKRRRRKKRNVDDDDNCFLVFTMIRIVGDEI
jgi:hypothetical protein